MESIQNKQYIVYSPGQLDITILSIDELRAVFDKNRSEYEKLHEGHPWREILADENQKIVNRIFELH